jgi:hypothetical protein
LDIGSGGGLEFFVDFGLFTERLIINYFGCACSSGYEGKFSGSELNPAPIRFFFILYYLGTYSLRLSNYESLGGGPSEL